MKRDIEMIPIHDIKPLMEVPDSSFTFLVILLLVGSLLLSGILYLLIRFLRTRKRVNHRQLHYTVLKEVDFSNAKRAAYTITEHGRFFADDSQRLHEAYENLLEQLEPYKYRAVVGEIDEESRSYYKIYLEMIDV